jgi:transcriptional regulator with XRE-family HTH domain
MVGTSAVRYFLDIYAPLSGVGEKAVSVPLLPGGGSGGLRHFWLFCRTLSSVILNIVNVTLVCSKEKIEKYFCSMAKKKGGPKKGAKYIGTNKYPFGQVMAAARMKKGYTQAELAEISDLSRRVISSLEREVQNPTTETVKKVADALKIPVEQLLFPGEIAKTTDEEQIDKSLYRRFQTAQKLPQTTKNELKKIIDAMTNAHGLVHTL